MKDLDSILPLVPEHRVCIQAGGAAGTWPARLAQVFKVVYSFEPCPENFPALVENTPPNVFRFQAALGACRGMVSMHLDDFERDNAGAWYVKADDQGRVPVMRIDDLELPACDLIQLDIEGAEINAVLGALTTIKQFWPVIVVEEKHLPHMDSAPDRARTFLADYGYREVARVHNDVVLAPGASC